MEERQKGWKDVLSHLTFVGRYPSAYNMGLVIRITTYDSMDRDKDTHTVFDGELKTNKLQEL